MDENVFIKIILIILLLFLFSTYRQSLIFKKEMLFQEEKIKFIIGELLEKRLEMEEVIQK